MSDNAEAIERLARKLEQQNFLTELRSCETLEDFQKLTEKYEAICSEQK